jgi:CRP/FNR family transcriptional regulator, nitrogen fixation regulation protein
MPRREAERILRTMVSRARHAELFAYDDRKRNLSPPKERIEPQVLPISIQLGLGSFTYVKSLSNNPDSASRRDRGWCGHPNGMECVMYRQVNNNRYLGGGTEYTPVKVAVAQSGQLDALVALERIGVRLNFARNQEIYAEGDNAGCWYKVVSGTVRISKLLADGRRYVAEFCFAGDCFGLDNTGERPFSAEAVSDAVVMRLPRHASEQLIDANPALARLLRETMMRDLANAYGRMLLLGRMTAAERVAAFLIEMFERCDRAKRLDLPMSRNDIADYLGLTIETVCRVLSGFKRDGMITIPNAHSIELTDREALETAAEA